MRPPLRPPRARPAPGIGRLASPVQSSPKLAASAMPRPCCAGAGAARLLQVDVLCGAGVLQVLLVVLQEGAAADRAPQHSAAALRPVNLLPGLRAARPPTPDSPAPWLLLTLPLSVERPSPAGPGPRPTAPAPPPLSPAPAPPHSSLVPPWDSTHPTLWATGLIDSWETKTWQAKRLSRGCLVMKPK